jgi:hypothetical protein
MTCAKGKEIRLEMVMPAAGFYACPFAGCETAPGRLRQIFMRDGVDDLRQAMIPGGNGVAGIKSRKLKIHLVIPIGPAGMVIHFLGSQRYFGHKSKGFLEIFETKGFDQAVVFFLPHFIYHLSVIRYQFTYSAHSNQQLNNKTCQKSKLPIRLFV